MQSVICIVFTAPRRHSLLIASRQCSGGLITARANAAQCATQVKASISETRKNVLNTMSIKFQRDQRHTPGTSFLRENTVSRLGVEAPSAQGFQ